MRDEQDVSDSLFSIPWFQELEKEHIERLTKIAQIYNIESGLILFTEGDKEDYLYVVLEGRVAIEMYVPGRDRVRVYTAEPMDIVGWSSVTPVVRQRTASATAMLPSRLVAFDSVKLRQLCEEDHDLGYVIMRRLATVVATRLLITRLQLLDMFSHRSPGE